MEGCGCFLLLELPLLLGPLSWGEVCAAHCLRLCLAQVTLSCVYFAVLGMMGVCPHTCVCVCLHAHVCVPTCACVCAQVDVPTCPCVCPCVYPSAHVCPHTHVCAHACVQVSMCVSKCPCVYTRVCAHVCMPTCQCHYFPRRAGVCVKCLLPTSPCLQSDSGSPCCIYCCYLCGVSGGQEDREPSLSLPC